MSNPWVDQEGGSHYKRFAIQPSEFITRNALGWFEGNVVKYVTRHAFKNGVEDLKKVMHYVRLILWDEYQHVPFEYQLATELKEFYPEVFAELEASIKAPLRNSTPEETASLTPPVPAIHINPPVHVHPDAATLAAGLGAVETWGLLEGGTPSPEPGPHVTHVRGSNSQVFARATIQKWQSSSVVPSRGEYVDKTMWRAGMGVDIEWPLLLSRVGPVTDASKDFQ